MDALKAAALSLSSSPLDEKSLFWQNVARAVEGAHGIAGLSVADKNYINAAIAASGASGTLDTAWTLAAQAQIYGSTVIGTAGRLRLPSSGRKCFLRPDEGSASNNRRPPIMIFARQSAAA